MSSNHLKPSSSATLHAMTESDGTALKSGVVEFPERSKISYSNHSPGHHHQHHSLNDSGLNRKQILIEEHKSDMVAHFNRFRNENQFTDVFIYVEGVEFPCHKVVLCAASCYFKAMFSCDLKESRQGKVFIENISPWTMKRILDFIYTGKGICR